MGTIKKPLYYTWPVAYAYITSSVTKLCNILVSFTLTRFDINLLSEPKILPNSKYITNRYVSK